MKIKQKKVENLIVAIEDFDIFVNDARERIERNTLILDQRRKEYLQKLQEFVENTKKVFQSLDGGNYSF